MALRFELVREFTLGNGLKELLQRFERNVETVVQEIARTFERPLPLSVLVTKAGHVAQPGEMTRVITEAGDVPVILPHPSRHRERLFVFLVKGANDAVLTPVGGLINGASIYNTTGNCACAVYCDGENYWAH